MVLTRRDGNQDSDRSVGHEMSWLRDQSPNEVTNFDYLCASRDVSIHKPAGNLQYVVRLGVVTNSDADFVTRRDRS